MASSPPDAIIIVSPSNNLYFNGVQQYDMLFATTCNIQSICFGYSNIYMKIASNGNVGIGTSNPSAVLDVAGTVNISGDLNFNGILKKNGSTYSNNLWTNNSSDIFILSSNVGIGVSNPSAVLDVAGTANFRSNMTIYGGTSLSNTLNISSLTTLSNGLTVYNNGNTMLSNTVNIYGATTLSNTLIVYSNVRIGTNIPAASTALDVAGTVNIRSNMKILGIINNSIQLDPTNSPANYLNLIYANQILQNNATNITSVGGYTQATAAFQPTYYSSGGYSNLPYMRFNGNNSSNYLSLTPQTYNIKTNGGFTMTTFMKFNSNLIYPRIFTTANTGYIEIIQLNLNIQFDMGRSSGGPGNFIIGTNTNPITLGEWALYTFRVNGTNNQATIYKNMSQIASGTTTYTSNITQTINLIGNSLNGDPYLSADISHMAIYDSFISDTTLSNMLVTIQNSVSTPTVIGENAIFNKNVGIGTANPTFTLDVTGAAYAAYAARINTSTTGGILFGNLTSSNSSANGIVQIAGVDSSKAGLSIITTNSVTQPVVTFHNPNGQIGNITLNASTTAYNTSSDYRLKTNIEPLTNIWETFIKLNPVTFNFKSDLNTQVQGFIAHELQEVAPLAVYGQKDAIDYQGIDANKLIPLLVAALKDLKTELSHKNKILLDRIEQLYLF